MSPTPVSSTILIFYSTATAEATYTYDAYGAHPTVGGPNQTVANNNPWRYTSGLLDAATGLYKYGQCYYQPGLGRWTQQDDVEHIGDLSQGDRYVYSSDDAVDTSDPSGRDDVTYANQGLPNSPAYDGGGTPIGHTECTIYVVGGGILVGILATPVTSYRVSTVVNVVSGVSGYLLSTLC